MSRVLYWERQDAGYIMLKSRRYNMGDLVRDVATFTNVLMGCLWAMASDIIGAFLVLGAEGSGERRKELMRRWSGVIPVIATGWFTVWYSVGVVTDKGTNFALAGWGLSALVILILTKGAMFCVTRFEIHKHPTMVVGVILGLVVGWAYGVFGAFILGDNWSPLVFAIILWNLGIPFGIVLALGVGRYAGLPRELPVGLAIGITLGLITGWTILMGGMTILSSDRDGLLIGAMLMLGLSIAIPIMSYMSYSLGFELAKDFHASGRWLIVSK